MTRVAPRGDPGGILERQVEPPKFDQQAEVLDVRVTIVAVGVLPPRGPWQPARALVEPDCVRRDADFAREFADPHLGKETLDPFGCQDEIEFPGPVAAAA